MDYYEYPYAYYGDERQFFPGGFPFPGSGQGGQFPGGTGRPPGQFPGVGPGGQPGFPNFGQFPGGGTGRPPGQFPGDGPGGQPGFPGQFPGGGPGRPPGQFPGSGPGAGQAGAPTSPPPSFTPQQPQFQTLAVDPGAIRGCLFRFTYVWLRGRSSFWFYPTFVGRNSVAGFRWTGYRWVYFGTDLNRIQSFQCF